MEVLQTSALPLGDGAGWNSWIVQGGPAASRRGDNSTSGRQCAGSSLRSTSAASPLRRTTFASQLARQPKLTRETGERRLERETGFEPATSTLARSHSTTELFPLATKIQRTTADQAHQDERQRPSQRTRTIKV